MPFQKNDPRINKRGRPPINRDIPADMRSKIKSFVDDVWPKMLKSWDQLDDERKWMYLTKLLPYITPAMRESDISISADQLNESQLKYVVHQIIHANHEKTDR